MPSVRGRVAPRERTILDTGQAIMGGPGEGAPGTYRTDADGEPTGDVNDVPLLRK